MRTCAFPGLPGGQIRATLLCTVVAAFAIAVALPAGTASAHNHTVTATCEGGLVVSLTSYDGTNSLKVTVDANTLFDSAFGTTYAATFANPDKTVAHSFRVVVVHGDVNDPYSFDQTLPVPACQEPTTTTTTTTTTMPETTTTITTVPVTTTTLPVTTTVLVTTTTMPVTTTVPVTVGSVAQEAPGTTAPAATTTTTRALAVMLPATGGGPGTLAMVGAVLLGIGVTMMLLRRPGRRI